MRHFGQLEAVVMDLMWAYGAPVTVRDVLEDLRRDRSIAYTTVMTVMDNLHSKGLLDRDMSGRAYRYVPVHSREQHNALLMRELLAGSQDRATTLLHFVEQMPVEDVARLRQAVEDHTPSRRARLR